MDTAENPFLGNEELIIKDEPRLDEEELHNGEDNEEANTDGLPNESENSTSCVYSFQEVVIKEEPHYGVEELQNNENKGEVMIDFPTCDRNPLSLENDPLELDHCIKREIKHEEYEVPLQGDTMEELTSDCDRDCLNNETLIDTDGKTENKTIIFPDSNVHSDFDIDSEQCYRAEDEDNTEEVGGTIIKMEDLDENFSRMVRHFEGTIYDARFDNVEAEFNTVKRKECGRNQIENREDLIKKKRRERESNRLYRERRKLNSSPSEIERRKELAIQYTKRYRDKKRILKYCYENGLQKPSTDACYKMKEDKKKELAKLRAKRFRDKKRLEKLNVTRMTLHSVLPEQSAVNASSALEDRMCICDSQIPGPSRMYVSYISDDQTNLNNCYFALKNNLIDPTINNNSSNLYILTANQNENANINL